MTIEQVVAAKDNGPQASTHFPNLGKAPTDNESGFRVRNQQDPTELLYDEDDEGGSTHFPNLGKPGPNTPNVLSASRQIQTPVKRIQTGAARRLQASVDIPKDEASGYTEPVNGPDRDAAFGSDSLDGELRASQETNEEGPQATTYFPNTGLPKNARAATLSDLGPNSDANSSGMSGSGLGEELEDDHDVEAAPEHAAPEHQEHNGFPEEQPEQHHRAPEAFAPEMVEEEEIVPPVQNFGEGAGEAMPLMDVDCMDDTAEYVATASFGTNLHVIKSNRIIATMTKEQAVKAGCSDVYLGDQFHTAALSEFEAQGLRAGLKSMGFVTAKVNIGSSEVLNKRVAAQAQAVTASIKRTAQASNAALGQCLAIAAVGVNTGFFKDVRNELRAALETELASAGVRNADRLIQRVFATHGIDYAKSILTKANTLVSMPEAGRNSIAAAMDMTSGQFDPTCAPQAQFEGEECDEFGNPMSPDFGAEQGFGPEDGSEMQGFNGDGFDGVEEFEDDFIAQEPAPETIQAALARPAYRVSAAKTGYSVSAAAILNGDVPLDRVFASF